VKLVKAQFMNTKSEKQLDEAAVAWLVQSGDEDAKGGRCRVGDKAKNIFVTLEITGPHHVGREIREWHLYTHPSITAMKIGREKLAELSYACGKLEWEHPSELVGNELVVHTRVERDPRYGDKCKIKQYQAPGSALATADAGHGAVTHEPFNDGDIPF
jgi:hypothetical protein